ncbi:MAG: stress response translation initiation inhibitor YciH [Anaerolineaceae bacterium]|nr:stress response translation initiation inhibitor YciH [Anaerolineaceae bacterium]
MYNSNNNNPTVYSTEFGRICKKCGKPENQCNCKKGKPQKPDNKVIKDGVVRLRLERKGRGGKAVTLVEGLVLHETGLKELSKELKKICGTGGALKNGIIEIQGDQRDKLLPTLSDKGFVVKKAGG